MTALPIKIAVELGSRVEHWRIYYSLHAERQFYSSY